MSAVPAFAFFVVLLTIVEGVLRRNRSADEPLVGIFARS